MIRSLEEPVMTNFMETMVMIYSKEIRETIG